MSSLIKKMKFKKPIIEYFKIISKFNLSGGIIDIKWKSKNHFLTILQFGFNIKFYKNISSTSFFIYKPEKINLITVGVFGIATSSVFIEPLEIERTVKKRKYLDNRDVFKIRSKLNKPIISDFEYSNGINRTVLLNNSFVIKNIPFKINKNKLKFTQ